MIHEMVSNRIIKLSMSDKTFVFTDPKLHAVTFTFVIYGIKAVILLVTRTFSLVPCGRTHLQAVHGIIS